SGPDPPILDHGATRPDYGRASVRSVQVSEGLEILGGPQPLYLTTNVPALYVQNGQPFRLDRARYFALSSTMGELDEAMALFERLVGHANPLGRRPPHREAHGQFPPGLRPRGPDPRRHHDRRAGGRPGLEVSRLDLGSRIRAPPEPVQRRWTGVA